MPKITFVDSTGQKNEVEAKVGESLLQVTRRHKIDLEGACEGSLACSTCHVVVQPNWYDRVLQWCPCSEDEEDMLDLAFGLTNTSRLGCQVVVTQEMDGLTVTIPPQTRHMVPAPPTGHDLQKEDKSS